MSNIGISGNAYSKNAFINSGAIILGGLAGPLLSRIISQRLQDGLPPTFALASMAIGITMIIKAHFIPVVVMALILGTALWWLSG
ncbi:hypothetical protein BFW38_03650 [Terasakiispira papahanaumokuakeensis]|uniref:Major facilitator superfamily (MFS) profile domain-containing protein n=1 Tax=Terasakiispira papahanaumokuakeensis TaxID=197479 RepID=A0A1E2V709_9GAMM|nr:hypothetical protein BFW38_03650 [Terasakiispira papahanaumokuakeensis]